MYAAPSSQSKQIALQNRCSFASQLILGITLTEKVLESLLYLGNGNEADAQLAVF